jgi:hypothetical protein
MADTDFNVENLRIKDLPPLNPAVAKPRRQQQREFIMVTQEQSDRLDKAANLGTERVFRHLLFLTWREWRTRAGKPVTLANAELARKGVDRRTKWRALLELEALGLIRMERRYKKSPIVTVLGG